MKLLQMYGRNMRFDMTQLPPKIPANTNLKDMTFSEIQKLIWQDIDPATHISLRDRFSDEALTELINHPCIDDFPHTFRSWLWDALETLDQEMAA